MHILASLSMPDCPHVTTGEPQNGFSWISVLVCSIERYRRIPVSLKSDNTSRHFTWKLTYVFACISIVTRWNYVWNKSNDRWNTNLMHDIRTVFSVSFHLRIVLRCWRRVDCTASNGGTIHESERIWEEEVVWSSYYFGICLEGLRQTTKLRVTGVLTEIRTECFPNTSLDCYCWIILHGVLKLRCFGYN
jgi:hypothetical protein